MATLSNFSKLFNFAARQCLRRSDPAFICKQNYSVVRQWDLTRPISKLRTRLPWMEETPEHQVDVTHFDEEKEKLAEDVTKAINKQIATNTTGRLFAVVHLCGKQFKITENDIIIVEGNWPPNPGDQIKLEKVLLVGSTDFTLVGQPILNRELVSVDATVIEKNLSHTKTLFRFKRRKQYRRLNFLRVYQTTLRINNISVNGNIDEKKEVEGLDRIY